MTKTWAIFVKWAIIGSLGLSLFYFLVSSLLGRNFSSPVGQFILLQPWISFVILSFGAQVGLYKVIRSHVGMARASGGVNGAAMIACCAHHASDLLPFLGISGLGLWLTAYQKDFLILALVINLFTIFYFSQFLNFKRIKVLRYSLLFVTIIVAIFGLYSVINENFVQISSETIAKENQHESQVTQVGLVEVEVVPEKLIPGKEMVFALSLNNHLIELDYDFTKIVTVVDDMGNVYKPTAWDGGRGGHHLSGKLEFSKLSSKARHIGLNINGIDGQRALLSWDL